MQLVDATLGFEGGVDPRAGAISEMAEEVMLIHSLFVQISTSIMQAETPSRRNVRNSKLRYRDGEMSIPKIVEFELIWPVTDVTPRYTS